MNKEFKRPFPISAFLPLCFLILFIVFLLPTMFFNESFLCKHKIHFYITCILIFLLLKMRQIWPLIIVKNNILYIAQYGFWKHKTFPFNDIAHIEIIRRQNLSIGEKDYSNYMYIETKNGQSFQTNLFLKTEDDCNALDSFLNDALPNIKVEIENHHWKENWS